MTTSLGSTKWSPQPDEQAAFERLVSHNYYILRRDLHGQPDAVLRQAALILAEGSRRRLNHSGNDDSDETDIRALRALFRPESGSAASGMAPVTVTS